MRQSYTDLFKAARLAVEHSVVTSDETVVVLTDTEKNPAIAEAFHTASVASGAETVLITMETRPEILMDPPKAVIKALMEADVVFDAVTKAWIYAPAMSDILGAGTRCLQILVPESGILARPPDPKVIERAKAVRKLLGGCETLRITSALGTDITFHRGDRPAHAQDGVVTEPGEWDSIATGISAFAPLEDQGDGVVMIDGTVFLPMDEHYLTKQPIQLTLEGGRIVEIKDDSELASRVIEWLAGWDNANSYVVSHTGFGLDSRAKVSPPDPGAWESILGSVNLAFGSNTIPQLKGENPCPSHLDFVIIGANVEIDGRTVLKDGQFTAESGMPLD